MFAWQVPHPLSPLPTPVLVFLITATEHPTKATERRADRGSQYVGMEPIVLEKAQRGNRDAADHSLSVVRKMGTGTRLLFFLFVWLVGF